MEPKDKTKKVIFIGGSSYSGSTMLDMMVANSSDGFSVGEVHALFRPFRPHHFNPECGCGDPECNFWSQIRSKGENKLYSTIFSIFPEINFIVDSSKDPFWIYKQNKILNMQGYKVYNLLIWKEPAAFAYSKSKRGKNNWSRAWKRYYRLYFTLFNDFMTVPYEELSKTPDDILFKICRYVGIDFNHDKKEFWNKQHHILFGNRSAKIHLKKDNIKESEYNTENLQKIYHDKSYINKLSSQIFKNIESNKKLQKMLNVLKNENINNKINEISYSKLTITCVFIYWKIKHIIKKFISLYSYKKFIKK